MDRIARTILITNLATFLIVDRDDAFFKLFLDYFEVVASESPCTLHFPSASVFPFSPFVCMIFACTLSCRYVYPRELVNVCECDIFEWFKGFVVCRLAPRKQFKRLFTKKNR